MAEETAILARLKQSVIDGDEVASAATAHEAAQAGLDAQEAIMQGLVPGMAELGRLYEAGDCFVPELMVGAEALYAGLDVLQPLVKKSDTETRGKGVAVIGAVQGDIHDIGKNLVKMMMEGAGFEIVDLGTDVKPQDFVAAVREHKPDLVGMSALLTTTMVNMKATIEALQEAGLRDSVKIMVGGAPVTQEYARDIGADAFAPDAAAAVDIARELTS
jgi:5-methyltetrahydrofolate--homocysteine methyltransferase